MSDRVDVVIAGAGPAGSLLAYHLASCGLKVLMIDRKPYPRYKACGGGLTRRALDSLPFDIGPVVEDYTCRANMCFRGRVLCSALFDDPVIAMVMRDRFDHYLAMKAMEKGARFQDATLVDGVSGHPGNLTVSTSRGKVHARIVAGADGVNSRIARALGLTVRTRYMAAVEAELYFKRPMDIDRFRGTVHYDFGVIPGGYGWVFPKRDHLSVGVGTFAGNARGWQRHFHGYLHLKGLNRNRKIHPMKGHLIPVRPHTTNVLSCSRGLVLGDAAGYSDPLTGEGLYFAIQEAAMAASFIREAVAGEYGVLKAYTGCINRRFSSDSVAAALMADMVYSFSGLGRKILTAHARNLAENQLAVICGKMTYTGLAKQLLLQMINPMKTLPVLFA